MSCDFKSLSSQVVLLHHFLLSCVCETWHHTVTLHRVVTSRHHSVSHRTNHHFFMCYTAVTQHDTTARQVTASRHSASQYHIKSPVTSRYLSRVMSCCHVTTWTFRMLETDQMRSLIWRPLILTSDQKSISDHKDNLYFTADVTLCSNTILNSFLTRWDDHIYWSLITVIHWPHSSDQ